MIDFNDIQSRIEIIGQEGRALLRSTPSAWSMPEDGQGCMCNHIPLPSRSSFGCKAKNLLSWCEAPNNVIQVKYRTPVGHMSGLYILLLNGHGHRIEHTVTARPVDVWPEASDYVSDAPSSPVLG